MSKHISNISYVMEPYSILPMVYVVMLRIYVCHNIALFKTVVHVVVDLTRSPK